ncbi:MAG: ABC transporter permease [Clostridiales bacterium]|nr:ABC transporter permease [Clostridiales bacterium]
MITLISSSIKLLFRNKGFLFFLIVIPVLSSLILGMQNGAMGAHSYELVREVVEHEDVGKKVVYYGNDGAFVIKVFDASLSESSEYMLDELAGNGAFIVVRIKTPDITKETVDAQIKDDGENDRMGAAMFLHADFDQKIAEGKTGEAMTLYVMSDDARFELFENEVRMIFQRIGEVQDQAGIEGAGEVLRARQTMKPEKEVTFLSGKNSRRLTDQQQDQRSTMGYAFAIMTLAYVLSGTFVAHTIIKEENDQVLSRLRLTGLSSLGYFGAKFAVSAVSSAAVTAVLGICTLFFDESKFGMGRGELLLLMFFLGLIFSSISLDLGVLMGDVMNANITAFTIWSMSSLLAGTYFPLDDTSALVKALSAVMPQKWFLEGTEMIFVGDSKVIPMLLCVVLAYMVLALTLGSVGMKFRHAED